MWASIYSSPTKSEVEIEPTIEVIEKNPEKEILDNFLHGKSEGKNLDYSKNALICETEEWTGKTGSSSLCNAVLITTQGHALISNHCVKKELKKSYLSTECTTINGSRYQTSILQSKDFEDIALLKLENFNEEIDPLYLFKATFVVPGARATIKSYNSDFSPINTPKESIILPTIFEKTFTAINTMVKEGMSGSPVYKDGNLIGVVCASTEDRFYGYEGTLLSARDPIYCVIKDYLKEYAWVCEDL